MDGLGRNFVFISEATNVVPGAATAIYAYHRMLSGASGTTMLASALTNGTPAESGSLTVEPAICGNGRTLGFISDARNLVPGDTNDRRDAFVGFIFPLDLTPPVINITAPMEDQEVGAGVAVRADIVDDSNTNWALFVDGVFNQAGTGRGTNAVNVTVNLAAGAHVIQIRATDEAENDAVPANRNFRVASDTTPPVINLTSPATDLEFLAPGSRIRAGITDASGVSWEVFLNGRSSLTGTTSGVNAIDALGPAAPGCYTLEIRARDTVGNVSTPVTRRFQIVGSTTVTLSPSSVSFSTTTVNQTSASRTLRITNSSRTVAAVIFFPQNPNQGLVVPGRALFVQQEAGQCFVIPPRGSLTFRYTFRPLARGATTGTLELRLSATVRKTVSLRGTGR